VTGRPSAAIVDLDALRDNASVLRKIHGGRTLAVLKANAYGHGAVRCAQALQGITDGLAVAFIAEALALRSAGVQVPILLLEGPFEEEEVRTAVEQELWLVVHHEEQIRMIELSSAAPGSLRVWLKIDTGMHRAGFLPAQVRDAYSRLLASAKVQDIVLMTHFARADERGSDATLRQVEQFRSATEGLSGARSLCNSAGMLAWPNGRGHWGRAGIALYGVDPLDDAESPVKPVMTLVSEIFADRWIEAGESLGYGAAFVASAPTRVGLVAIGYADGYPRGAGTGTPVKVNGRTTRVIGRVSMDMMTVDLTSIPDAGIGSPVELWGPCISINDVASSAGTIAYELLCNVKRVPFRYIGE
jgi:alanine racemase